VAQFVALETGTCRTVVVVMLSQAVQALRLLPFLQAVLGDVTPLAASKTLHQVSFLITPLLQQTLEITHWPPHALLSLSLLSLLPLLLLIRLPFFLLALFALLLAFTLFLLLPCLFFLLLICPFLLLCDLLEALLQIQVADVLGGLIPLDAVGEQCPRLRVDHGILTSILLHGQLLVLVAGGLDLDLLQTVDIEDVVFA
jgi:hypothetical protein